jgi:hypothetical protein
MCTAAACDQAFGSSWTCPSYLLHMPDSHPLSHNQYRRLSIYRQISHLPPSTACPLFLHSATSCSKSLPAMYTHTQTRQPRRLLEEEDDALQLGPRKKPFVVVHSFVPCQTCDDIARCLSDPLIHYGRHFGRTCHALCSVRPLLKNGLLRLERITNGDPGLSVRFVFIPFHTRLPDGWPWDLHREEKEHRVFQSLLGMIPGLESRLLESSEEELRLVADLAHILFYTR